MNCLPLRSVASTVLTAAAPDSCLASGLNVGYLYPGEDDFPYQPTCMAKGESQQLACFPGDARVLVAGNEWTSIRNLKIGNFVATDLNTTDGTLIYSKVVNFLHNLPHAAARYVDFQWVGTGGKTGTASLSLDHLVYVSRGTRNRGSRQSDGFVPAKSLLPGDEVILGGVAGSLHERAVVVSTRLSGLETRGLHAPITDSTSGKLFVDNVLVSEFSRLPLLHPRWDGATHSMGVYVSRAASKLLSRSLLTRAIDRAAAVVQFIATSAVLHSGAKII